MALFIKQCLCTCTLHSYPIYMHTDRHTGAQPLTIVSQSTLHCSAKLPICTLFQFKVMLIDVNSTDYPAAGLKHTPTCYCFGLLQAQYLAYVSIHIIQNAINTHTDTNGGSLLS